MVVFAHLKDVSSLFVLLPIELIAEIFFRLKNITFILKDHLFVSLHTLKDASEVNDHELYNPRAITIDPATKQVFVSDETHFVKVVEKSLQFGGKGTRTGQFNKPTGITFSDKTKKLYVCDTYNHRVQLFDSEGHFLSYFGNQGTKQGKLICPFYVSLSENEHSYVSDYYNNRVQVYDEDGGYLFSFGEEGSLASQFNHPIGISVSKCSEKVFVSDFGNSRIQVFSQNGQYLFGFGQAGKSEGCFNVQWGLKVDEEENVFVADKNNHRIQVFDEKGNFLLTFGCKGSEDQQMKYPWDVDVCDGHVFVCDYYNCRVQVWK